MTKEQLNVRVPSYQLEQLKFMADSKGIPQSQLVRDALDQYMDRWLYKKSDHDELEAKYAEALALAIRDLDYWREKLQVSDPRVVDVVAGQAKMAEEKLTKAQDELEDIRTRNSRYYQGPMSEDKD